MNSSTKSRDIHAIRLAGDGSLCFVAECGVQLQLSQRQLQLIQLVNAAPPEGFPREELYAALFRHAGTANASSRASVSRMLKRLREQGLLVVEKSRLRPTDYGATLIGWAREQYADLIPNVNRGADSAPLLTLLPGVAENDTPLTSEPAA